MSYILEALQKSERKRQKDAVPDLQAVHVATADTKDKRSIWPWLLVAVLIVNTILWASFLLPSRDASFLTDQRLPENQTKIAPPQSLTVKSSVYEPKNETLSVKSDTPLPVTTESSPPAAMQSETTVETKTTNAVIPAPQHPVATEQTPDVLRTIEEIPLAEERVNVNTPSENTEQGFPKAEKTIAGPVDIPKPADFTRAEDELVAELEPTSVVTEIPLFEALPPSLNQRLPELSISFLAYSKKPSERIVSINGRILREGQTIGDDLTLEKITPAGAVINYRGDRFRLEVF